LGQPRLDQTLGELKQRLLQSAAPDANDEWQLRFLHLAAGEAEALAWLTPFPHLFLPMLLEEKLDAAKRYLVSRAGFRGER
jgi:hypothetical protein